MSVDKKKYGLHNIAEAPEYEETEGVPEVNKEREPVPGDKGDSIYHTNLFLTDAQMEEEFERCNFCEEKPCRDGCPVNCSPADFIRAAEVHQPSDIKRSAARIMTLNPLGGICGQTCPDKFCMDKCVHNEFDEPIQIPPIQATVVEKAKRMGKMPELEQAEPNGMKVAVVGGGPAGLAAGAMLAQEGYTVDIFEKDNKPGGACNIIPDFRLDKQVLRTDIEWSLEIDNLELEINKEIENPEELVENGDYDGAIVTVGLWEPLLPGIPGEEKGIPGLDYLENPENYDLEDKQVAVIGGGATAFDCAVVAQQENAGRVEMFVLENLKEMPLTDREMSHLTRTGIDVNCRVQVEEILEEKSEIAGVKTSKLKLNSEEFSLDALEPIEDTEASRRDIDEVIFAIGAQPEYDEVDHPDVFHAGDCIEGPTTVVEASAAGKNVAEKLDSHLNEEEIPSFPYTEEG
ncbi:MAG: FAD-dependent oxidoreductase, partial [bacterium]